MRCLLDTNVLIRLVLVDQPLHSEVMRAVEKLQAAGDELCCTVQSLREVWHTGTRSKQANGFGLKPEDVNSLISQIQLRCELLTEDESTFDLWREIVVKNGIVGATCHDANHVAIAVKAGVQRIVTFDTRHFQRFALAGMEITRPEDV